ncbi:MAG: CPBP family intramembrane metalloprotease [Phycisphaerales bacterium]|nr:CPBP family intramembrane metalloprotease [Phycisphaerales bacterium]MCB9854867.1 CPBP family intramembrane metalloprotease [Phycisphaerales bacterium]
MGFDLTRVSPADLLFLALGLIVLLVAIARSSIRGTWTSDLQIPWPPGHSLNRFDVVLAAWVYLTLGLIGAVVAQSFFSGDPIASSQPAGGAVTPSAATLMGGTIGHVASIWILCRIGRDRFDGGARAWGLHVRRPGNQLAVAICVTLAALPICYGVLNLTQWVMEAGFQMKPEEHPSIELLRDGRGSKWLITLTILNAVVIAPIVEELLFRGILLPALAKWLKSPVTGLLLSSAFFGLIHYSVPKTVPALFVFGVILGVTYLKRNSLVAPICVHALFNLKTVIWLLLGWDR